METERNQYIKKTSVNQVKAFAWKYAACQVISFLAFEKLPSDSSAAHFLNPDGKKPANKDFSSETFGSHWPTFNISLTKGLHISFWNAQHVCVWDMRVCVLSEWNNAYLSLLNLRECRMAGRLWRRFHKCSVSSAQAATKAPCGRKKINNETDELCLLFAMHFSTEEKII